MSALILGILLGAALRHYLPRAWAEATAADREEAMRGVPRRRGAR